MNIVTKFFEFSTAYIVLLGKGALAWTGLILVSWLTANATGSLVVISSTPSLENSVFMVKRVEEVKAEIDLFKNQILVACLNEKQAIGAKENGLYTEQNYASNWLGCDQGAWIKRVAAIAGDTVEITGGVILVNDAPISIIPKREHNGTVAAFYKSNATELEKTLLKQDDVFLVGDHNLSYDSRYVGLFNTKQIKGRVTRAAL